MNIAVAKPDKPDTASDNFAAVTARVPGAGGLPAIEDAPGSYVKVRLID